MKIKIIEGLFPKRQPDLQILFFRYQLQEEILNKDQTVECLRQKVNCLQSELRVVVKENTILSSKLNKSGVSYHSET